MNYEEARNIPNVILVSFSKGQYLADNIDELAKLVNFLNDRYIEIETNTKEIGAMLAPRRWVNQTLRAVYNTMRPNDDVCEINMNGHKLFLANHSGFKAACKAAQGGCS